MTRYIILFQVLANDTGGLQDEAHVFIYLLREDQRVRFVLRAHPSEVRDKISIFRDKLAQVSESVVNIDDLRVHENKDGSVDNTKTDLYLHLVNGQDHSVLEVNQVLQLVDKNIEQLDDLFKVIPLSATIFYPCLERNVRKKVSLTRGYFEKYQIHYFKAM